MYKPLLNAGLLLLLVAVLFGLSCAGLVSYFACTTAGALAALELWFIALVGNQLAYQILVRQPKQAAGQ